MTLLTVDTTNCGKLIMNTNGPYYLDLEFESGWRGRYFGTGVAAEHYTLTFEAFGFMQEGFEFHPLTKPATIDIDFKYIRCFAALHEINLRPGNFQFEHNGRLWYGY